MNATGVHCQFPTMPPMLGFAVTLRVRSSNPPMEGGVYVDRTDWWTALEALPVPQVVVIQDMDRRPGVGAFVGEIHAAILQRLGCVGVVTNGAVRDLSAIESRGFQLFSATVSPSHSYVHVVDSGQAVQIGGLLIRPGDLLLGDRHGLLRIPPEVAADIPETVARIRAREREILDYCDSEAFSPAGLRQRLRNFPPAN